MKVKIYLITNTAVNPYMYYVGLTKNKLDKMKKDELIQILINMTPNIILSSKITKKECIKLICKE